MHQSTEMAHQEDVANCIELLTAGIAQLDTYDWDFSLPHGQGPHPEAGLNSGEYDWMG
jgi:hypothetical protein